MADDIDMSEYVTVNSSEPTVAVRPSGGGYMAEQGEQDGWGRNEREAVESVRRTNGFLPPLDSDDETACDEAGPEYVTREDFDRLHETIHAGLDSIGRRVDEMLKDRDVAVDNFALAEGPRPRFSGAEMLRSRARDLRDHANRLDMLAARLPALDEEAEGVLIGTLSVGIYRD
jgi:uncharacterized lipoprotein